jgi:hypothetical protein
MKRVILLTVFAMSLALGSSQACYLSCPATPQMVQQSAPIWLNVPFWLLFFHF